MIQRLHHAQITIPPGAEDECREFYCGVLGLNEIPKPSELGERRGFWLGLGEFQIHIGIENGIDRAASKAHLAYEVDDLAKWKSALENQNISVVDGVPVRGYERFDFRDPFGNRVEFLQRVS